MATPTAATASRHDPIAHIPWGRYRSRGFLPAADPSTRFPANSELAALDELGRDLPRLLDDPGFRTYARTLTLPPWPSDRVTEEDVPLARLYYLRLGFLAAAYVNQVGQEPARQLPANIAVPLCGVCDLLERPPILSYDGYVLYNWRRFRTDGPVALGNLDTLQDFVRLYDEHWFILVHVEIEAIGAEILAAVGDVVEGWAHPDPARINRSLCSIESAVRRQTEVLRRIPEHMDPRVYYKAFRPYIRLFEDVVYEGVNRAPMRFRGETGAQSSLMPLLLAFLKIPHQPSALTHHLAEMRHYMPADHRRLIASVDAMPTIRPYTDPEAFNGVLDAIASFREVHLRWAELYINRWTDDPRGTGGTPYMRWLRQLIDETRAYRLPKY